MYVCVDRCDVKNDQAQPAVPYLIVYSPMAVAAVFLRRQPTRLRFKTVEFAIPCWCSEACGRIQYTLIVFGFWIFGEQRKDPFLSQFRFSHTHADSFVALFVYLCALSLSLFSLAG